MVRLTTCRMIPNIGPDGESVEQQQVGGKWVKVLQTEDGLEVKDEDCVKGFPYGRQILAVADTDLYMFDFGEPKCLVMLASLKREKLHPEWRLGESDYLIHEKDGDSVLSSSLAYAMYCGDFVLLCRFTGRDKSKPRVCCLSASPSSSS